MTGIPITRKEAPTSKQDAIRNADSENDLRLRIKLESKSAQASELGESMRNVTF